MLMAPRPHRTGKAGRLYGMGYFSLQHYTHEGTRTMKQLTWTAIETMDKMTTGAGKEESEKVRQLLAGMTDQDLAFDIDSAIGAYLAARENAAFLAGIELARNPWPVFVEG